MTRIALTKNDKARVIIAALYGLKELPASTDSRVLKESCKAGRYVDERHKIALRHFETKAGA